MTPREALQALNASARADNFNALAFLERNFILQDTNKPIRFEPWQVEQVLVPVFRKVNRQRRYDTYLIRLPKKNGKSTVAACVGVYALLLDDPNPEVYSTARDKDQAGSGQKIFSRKQGEALHPEREPLEVLGAIRQTIGEYHFAGQFRQVPAPAGAGTVKIDWFRRFTPEERPREFEIVLQSWDTANKTSELSDYSACTTWGVISKHVYLLDVFRRRLDYPDLKRALKEPSPNL